MSNPTEGPTPLESAHEETSLKRVRGTEMWKQISWRKASVAATRPLFNTSRKAKLLVLDETILDDDGSLSSLKILGVRRWSEILPLPPSSGKLPQYVM